MLKFRVHQLQVGRRSYLLLPKLNPGQTKIFERRLLGRGFSVKRSRWLIAKSKEGIIRIDPSGLCWSTFDPADFLLPAIPDILACPKDRLPLDELKAMYFNVAESGGTTILRLAPRMESSSLWEALRKSGECGLAPDEREVASFLIREAGGTCRMLTDFSVEESGLRFHGRKPYYESTVACAEAASTLRAVEEKATRNSYLWRNGTLILSGRISPSRKDLAELFDRLDEWCYFAPA